MEAAELIKKVRSGKSAKSVLSEAQLKIPSWKHIDILSVSQIKNFLKKESNREFRYAHEVNVRATIQKMLSKHYSTYKADYKEIEKEALKVFTPYVSQLLEQ